MGEDTDAAVAPNMTDVTSPASVPERYESRLSVDVGVSRELRRNIILELARREWSLGFQSDLADSLDVSRTQMGRALATLVDDEVVVRRELGGRTIYNLDGEHSRYPLPPDIEPHRARASALKEHGTLAILTLQTDAITDELVDAAMYLSLYFIAAAILTLPLTTAPRLESMTLFTEVAVLVFALALVLALVREVVTTVEGWLA